MQALCHGTAFRLHNCKWQSNALTSLRKDGALQAEAMEASQLRLANLWKFLTGLWHEIQEVVSDIVAGSSDYS